jgi:Holliday junction resolvase-like predicted endonuclease
MKYLNQRLDEQRIKKLQSQDEVYRLKKEVADLKVQKADLNKSSFDNIIKPKLIVYLEIKNKLKQELIKANNQHDIELLLNDIINYARNINKIYNNLNIDTKMGIVDINIDEDINRNKIVGDAYECLVGLHYYHKGYEIKYNGILKGKEDGGIDLIAIKNNRIFFIQCKYRSKDSSINLENYNKFHTDYKKYYKNNKLYKNKDYEKFGMYVVTDKTIFNFNIDKEREYFR